MAKFDSLIFDLDGTLWDACASVAKGWNQALQSLALDHHITRDHIASVCGLPYEGCVRTLLPNIDETRFTEIVETLNRFEEASVRALGGELFPGVATGLHELSQHFPLYLVSNCQTWYLDSFLERFPYHSLFKDTECHGATGLPKSENIRLVVQRNSLQNPIYIGDTRGDQTSAQSAEVDFLFASYGFGNAESPRLQAQSFEELVRLLRG